MTRALPTRRRFLTIAAAAALVPGPGRAGPRMARWRGRAMGASASMALAGVSGAEARPVFAALEAELSRLERIFSLYRADSALVRLNRDGELPAPPGELLDVLSLCDALHRATGGAFDPTVQPLWLALANRQGADARRAARARLGWGHVRFDTGAVRFARPGMGLTLNGIAQGHIADRIAAQLTARGYRDVLVDMGEIVGAGHRPDGRAWQAGVATPDGRIVHRVALSDRALATSAPQGTVLDPASEQGHILDPRAGAQGGRPAQELASVSAPRAAVADGLSTAACLLSRGAAERAVAAFSDARLEALL